MGVLIKRGSRKGQEIMGMSVGTIFSIFIIAVIIAVAIYAIVHFLGINKCTNIGLFYEDLQDEVDKAWAGGRYSATYESPLDSTGALKTGVEEVCFGNLTSLFRFGGFSFRRRIFGFGFAARIFVFPVLEAGVQVQCDRRLTRQRLCCFRTDQGQAKIESWRRELL